MVTVEFGGTEVPAPGLVLHTVPAEKPAESELEQGTAVTRNPSFLSCVVASAWLRPTTPGTLVPPPDTTIVTVLPLATWAPPWGFCRITVPACAVEFGSFLALTSKPALSSCVVAAVADSPSTDGTVTLPAPVETSSVTVLFFATWVPADGLVLITSFLGTVVEGARVTRGIRCAFTMSCCALASGSPTTLGTA